MPLKVTPTPPNVLLTPPEEFNVKLAAVVGPSNVPFSVISSPGEITPAAPLALLVTYSGCGLGGAVTVNVTVTVSGVLNIPGDEIVMVPVYGVPVALPTRFCVFTETLTTLVSVDPLPPVVPVVVSTESQLVPLLEVVVPTVN